MFQAPGRASIIGIERFVAAILLAVAVAGAVAFPRLLGRVERVPALGFGTHPPSVTSVEAAPFPSAPSAAKPTLRSVAAPGGRLVLRPAAAPARTAHPSARPVREPARPTPAPSTPVKVTAPTPAPVSTPAPTAAPVAVAAPSPAVKVPTVPAVAVPPGKVILPVPTPVTLPAQTPLPGRPAEGQPIVVPEQHLTQTVTPPTQGDSRPVVTPPTVGIPSPVAPSPLGSHGSDGDSDNG